jgi:hypothetical protein
MKSTRRKAIYVTGVLLVALIGFLAPRVLATPEQGFGPRAILAAEPDEGDDDPGRIRSTAADRESVMITVYNQNFGLVREVRGIDLTRGLIELEFGDVASSIQTETVHIEPLSGRLQVLEQNYQYDLLSPQKLLEKYVGRTVKVYRYHPETGEEEMLEAEVLAVNGGTILKIGDEITFNYPGRIAFPEVPENLIAEPTLLWLANSRTERERLDVSYLANNLNWKSDYVMVIDKDDRLGDLTPLPTTAAPRTTTPNSSWWPAMSSGLAAECR